MIDIKFLREHPDIVKQNIKNKFQDEKLPLVDEVIDFDKKYRDIILTDDKLRSERNSNSKQIGILMGQGKKDEIKSRMMRIPNIMDPSVPIGKDDSENVEVQRFGEPKVPDYEIPYHADIIERFNGLDKESAGRTSGVGFYYLIILLLNW